MSISQTIIAYGDMFRGLDTKQMGYTAKQVLDANMHRWAGMAQATEDELRAEIKALKANQYATAIEQVKKLAVHQIRFCSNKSGLCYAVEDVYQILGIEFDSDTGKIIEGENT